MRRRTRRSTRLGIAALDASMRPRRDAAENRHTSGYGGVV